MDKPTKTGVGLFIGFPALSRKIGRSEEGWVKSWVFDHSNKVDDTVDNNRRSRMKRLIIL